MIQSIPDNSLHSLLALFIDLFVATRVLAQPQGLLSTLVPL